MLFGYDSCYITSLGLEIILHGFRLILAGFILENRLTLHYPSRVGNAGSVDSAAVEFHADLRGIELENLILHSSVTIKICIVETFEHKRVAGRECHGCLNVDFGTVYPCDQCPGGVYAKRIRRRSRGKIGHIRYHCIGIFRMRNVRRRRINGIIYTPFSGIRDRGGVL